MAFLATNVRGEMQISAEIIDAQWFSVDRLPQPVVPFTREAIRRALELRAQMSPAQLLRIGVA